MGPIVRVVDDAFCLVPHADHVAARPRLRDDPESGAAELISKLVRRSTSARTGVEKTDSSHGYPTV